MWSYESLITETHFSVEPRELLTWTAICRRGWEEYLRKRRDGLSKAQQKKLLHEYLAMEKLIHRIIPYEPVRVEKDAIVYDPEDMEENRIYPVEVLGRLRLVRKTKGNIVETIELESVETSKLESMEA